MPTHIEPDAGRMFMPSFVPMNADPRGSAVMIHPMNEPLPDTLVLLCRPGFERDCSAEIIDSLARTGVAAWCRAEAGAGLVEVRSGEGWDARRALAEIRFDALVFARDWLAGRMLDDLPVGDRITPLLAAARALGPFADCWLQHVDTGEGRSVGKLCARLQARVQGALAGEGLLARRAAMRLHGVVPFGQQGIRGGLAGGQRRALVDGHPAPATARGAQPLGGQAGGRPALVPR